MKKYVSIYAGKGICAERELASYYYSEDDGETRVQWLDADGELVEAPCTDNPEWEVLVVSKDDLKRAGLLGRLGNL